MLGLGLDIRRLGTSDLTYRRLLVIIAHLPRTSALFRAQHGEAADWSQTDYLLAGLFDAIEWGNWQRAGCPRGKRPKPTPRPATEKSGTAIGGERMTLTQAREKEARRQQRLQEKVE